MHRFKIFIFLLFPLTMISQHITGKVYDAETSVKGAKIFNKNANSITYTNETGSFKINALIRRIQNSAKFKNTHLQKSKI